ncbi:MAG: ArsA family ATPase [Bacteroidetes bacterium]|nr:ArsA family ATPase [Bacteroidota bacterium]
MARKNIVTMETASHAERHPPCLFHIGKGGTGKSTISALRALALARQGKRVLLLSLDPAHNLSDIFATHIGNDTIELCTNLHAWEVDIDEWITRALDDLQQRLRTEYAYLTAINLEQYFRVLQFSPGMEEFALRNAYEHALRTYSGCDAIVIDMPPTALALRFFASPGIALAWTEQLLQLRKTIKKKQDIVTNIRIGKHSVERDRILLRLQEQHASTSEMKKDFADATATRISVIINPDTLSWREALRILEGTANLGIRPYHLIINRHSADREIDVLPDALSALSVLTLPQSSTPLIGLRQLNAFLDETGNTAALTEIARD